MKADLVRRRLQTGHVVRKVQGIYITRQQADHRRFIAWDCSVGGATGG